MSDKDILEVAKNILESEETLDEVATDEVKPKKKGAVDVDAEGEKPEASPSNLKCKVSCVIIFFNYKYNIYFTSLNLPCDCNFSTSSLNFIISSCV